MRKRDGNQPAVPAVTSRRASGWTHALALSLGVAAAASAICVAGYLRAVHRPGTIVLMYHAITSSERDASRYALPVQALQAQLDYLQRQGFLVTLPTPSGSTQSPGAGRRQVVLTFDDGSMSQYLLGYRELTARGLPAVFCPVAGSIGTQGQMGAAELRDLAQHGMLIGSHTVSHPALDTLNTMDLSRELGESKAQLQAMAEEDVDILCLPGGWYDKRVIAAAQAAGYALIYGSDMGVDGANEIVHRRVEVPGTVTPAEFGRLLDPGHLVRQGTLQHLKRSLRGLLGASLYARLSRTR